MSISNELSFSRGIVMKPYISSLQMCKGIPNKRLKNVVNQEKIICIFYEITQTYIL